MDSQTIREALGLLQVNPDDQEGWISLKEALSASEGDLDQSDLLHLLEAAREKHGERGEWVGCIAGALSFEEYEQGLTAAGFVDVSLAPTHEVADGMRSAIIRATRS